jgi:hypothetical protein
LPGCTQVPSGVPLPQGGRFVLAVFSDIPVRCEALQQPLIDRLLRLERDVADLRVANASLAGRVLALESHVSQLEASLSARASALESSVGINVSGQALPDGARVYQWLSALESGTGVNASNSAGPSPVITRNTPRDRGAQSFDVDPYACPARDVTLFCRVSWIDLHRQRAVSMRYHLRWAWPRAPSGPEDPLSLSLSTEIRGKARYAYTRSDGASAGWVTTRGVRRWSLNQRRRRARLRALRRSRPPPRAKLQTAPHSSCANVRACTATWVPGQAP